MMGMRLSRMRHWVLFWHSTFPCRQARLSLPLRAGLLRPALHRMRAVLTVSAAPAHLLLLQQGVIMTPLMRL